jgi:hypothetical protein
LLDGDLFSSLERRRKVRRNPSTGDRLVRAATDLVRPAGSLPSSTIHGAVAGPIHRQRGRLIDAPYGVLGVCPDDGVASHFVNRDLLTPWMTSAAIL